MNILPSGWTVRIGGDEAADLDLRTPTKRSFAVGVYEEGPAALGLSLPRSELTVALAPFPTLDDVWTLYMLARLQAGVDATRPPSWEAVAHYAEQARQGLLPERVAPERAVQSVLRSISSATLPDEPAAFLSDALRLCELVDRRMAAGAKILDDDLVGDDPKLQRHLAFLDQDRTLYREDRARGQSFAVTLPPAGVKGPIRYTALLAVDRPVARLFKVWARRDDDAPSSHGYGLLVTQDERGEIVVSADPTKHIKLDWLAPLLSTAEKARGGEAWYDGTRHEGTLLGSPRSGTKLTLPEVLDVIRQKAKLVKPTGAKDSRTLLWSAVAGSIIIAFALFSYQHLKPEPRIADRADVPDLPAAMGPTPTPIPGDQKKVNLLDPKAGITKLTPYALVIGVCSYGTSPGAPLPTDQRTGPLRHSCNNAWEIAHLLVHDYHYDPKNVLLMLDDPKKVDHPEYSPMPTPGPTPTRHNVLLAIQDWQKQHPEVAEVTKMTFIFYYSGHGAVFEQHPDGTGLAYLELANWEADMRAGKPREDVGLPMDRLNLIISQQIPSKHVLYLLDNCHAGWALHMGADENPEIQNKWADGVTYGIAASQKDQSAWETGGAMGTSVFTQYLLKGLGMNEGVAAADENDSCGSPDHIVTHAELQQYLVEKVPAAAQNQMHAVQEPIGERLNPTTKGQFLFVAPDVEDYLTRRRCESKH